MRFVIVGNGVAGMEAALTIKDRHPDAPVTIISEESDHLFSRTALMWVFTGQLSHRCIEPLERDAYDRLGIRRVRARATGLDLERRSVRLGGGHDPVPFDRLVIACGSRARPAPWPGSELLGVGHFVTMQDLEWLEHELAGGPSRAGRPPRPDEHVSSTTPDSPYRPREAAASKRGRLGRAPAVIGGGLIGIEAIEIMAHRGLEPKFFIREEWFWPMAIEPRESAWITDRMREHGVDVRLDHEVEALEAGDDGTLAAIRTNRGTYDVDTCVVAIGVVPNTEWLKESGLELDRGGGILVDAQLRTNVDGVFAAGDCASVAWFDGSNRPEQLWYTARDQGRVAGRSALDEKTSYARPLWYNSAKLMDIEYTTAGIVNMQLENERNWFFEEAGEVRSTTRIVVQGDREDPEHRVVGFNLLGRRWDHEVLNQWIHQRRSLSWVLDHLHEASFDTEFVPPLVVPQSARSKPLGGPADNPRVAGPTPFTYA
jgi:NADPH-dependent 2,4-dienoyl-CoA reductase/sulfur reductase-like enzyme